MVGGGRIKSQTITVTVANGQATANGGTNVLNGIIRAISVSAPALTSANYGITVVGPASGFTLFSKTGLSPNAVSNIPSDGSANNMSVAGIPAGGGTGLRIDTAGNETGPKTFTVTLLVEH